jgi:hypothetical protein
MSFLGRILLMLEHGNDHGKMGIGTAEQHLWTTLFARAGIRGDINMTQADCGILFQDVVIPLSIKTSQGGPLAVNWGKNKTKIKFVFSADIIIFYHKKEKVAKMWKPFESGAYLVDPEWCNANIVLTSNNKSDYIIPGPKVAEMLAHAKSRGTYHEIVALPDDNTRFVMRDPHTREVFVARKPSKEMLE